MSKTIKLKDGTENVYPYPYFPIGSIYMSINNVNPSTYFGGTWEQLKDRFLLGAGDTYVNGNTGGEATHKLTTNEMPSHAHYGFYQQDGVPYVRGAGSTRGLFIGTSYGNYFSTSSDYTGNTGGGQEHNNMPPYLVVYMWKRTA